RPGTKGSRVLSPRPRQAVPTDAGGGRRVPERCSQRLLAARGMAVAAAKAEGRLGCAGTLALCRRGAGRDVRGFGGELDAEGRALADLALHLDAALVVLDDLLANRQAQPRSLGFALARRALGGE